MSLLLLREYSLIWKLCLRKDFLSSLSSSSSAIWTTLHMSFKMLKMYGPSHFPVSDICRTPSLSFWDNSSCGVWVWLLWDWSSWLNISLYRKSCILSICAFSSLRPSIDYFIVLAYIWRLTSMTLSHFLRESLLSLIYLWVSFIPDFKNSKTLEIISLLESIWLWRVNPVLAESICFGETYNIYNYYNFSSTSSTALFVLIYLCSIFSSSSS